MIDKIRSDSAPLEADKSSAIEGHCSFPKVSEQMFGRHSLLQMTLDNETVRRLREPNQYAHVGDEQGNIVGVFKAMAQAKAATYQYALETVDFDELDAAGDPSRPTYTIEQVREHLRRLEREQAECASR